MSEDKSRFWPAFDTEKAAKKVHAAFTNSVLKVSPLIYLSFCVEKLKADGADPETCRNMMKVIEELSK